MYRIRAFYIMTILWMKKDMFFLCFISLKFWMKKKIFVKQVFPNLSKVRNDWMSKPKRSRLIPFKNQNICEPIYFRWIPTVDKAMIGWICMSCSVYYFFLLSLGSKNILVEREKVWSFNQNLLLIWCLFSQ